MLVRILSTPAWWRATAVALLLSAFAIPAYSQQAITGRVTAAGNVLKRTASAELVRAIRAVAAGGLYIDPSLAGALLGGHAPRSPRTSGQHARATELTARESEVLKLVSRGHSNKEIAAVLELSVKTVETHKSNAMTKLGLTSRAALVHFAMGEGWFADVPG